MDSALVISALHLSALPDAAAQAPASLQDACVSREDCDISMDLTAELAGITDVSEEEEARLRAQAWKLEQTLEASAEQHFGSRLVEYERNMARARRSEEHFSGLWRPRSNPLTTLGRCGNGQPNTLILRNRHLCLIRCTRIVMNATVHPTRISSTCTGRCSNH